MYTLFSLVYLYIPKNNYSGKYVLSYVNLKFYCVGRKHL